MIHLRDQYTNFFGSSLILCFQKNVKTLKIHFIKSLNIFINGEMRNFIFWWGYNSQALVNKWLADAEDNWEILINWETKENHNPNTKPLRRIKPLPTPT